MNKQGFLRIMCIGIVATLCIACLSVLVSASDVSQLDPMPATTPLPYYPKGFAYERGGNACSTAESLGYGDYLRQSLSDHTIARCHGHGWSFFGNGYQIGYLIYICSKGGNMPEGVLGENFRIYLPKNMTTSGVFGELGKVQYSINSIYLSNYEVNIYIDDGNYTVPLRQTRTYPITDRWGDSSTQTFSVLFVNITSQTPSDEWVIVCEIDLRIYVAAPTIGDGRSIDINPETLFASMSQMFENMTSLFSTTLMVGMLDILAFGMALHYVVKLS